jgi:PAS domain S-box-containing protein
MSDTTKQQLIAENEELQRRVRELEAAVAGKERTGEALREREARLHEAQEVASLGFYVLDIPHGRWTSSPVLDQILGIPPDYTKTVEGWGDLVHPDDRQAMLDHLSREVIQQGKPCDREYRIIRCGDKQVRWVHGLGRLQFNEQGQPIVMLGTVQDITERKRAEEALRKSEIKFRSLYKDSVIGKAVVAPNGEVIQANPAFCEFLGYSEQELVGKTAQSITHPEDREKTAEVIRQALTSGPRILRFEKRYLHKSGRTLWGEVSSTLVCDAEGNPSYFIAQVLDIGKRKRAEEALQKAHDELEEKVRDRTAELSTANEELKREVEERRRAEETLWRSEERFRVAFEEAPVGMMIAVGDGIITRVNHAMSRISGYTPEELTGRNVCELIYPEDREQSVPLIEKLLAGKLPIVTLESRYLGKSGRVFWARTTTAAVHIPDGEMVFALGIVEDITERKRAEEALRQSEQKYKTLVETSPDGVIMADLKGRITFASQRVLQMYGTGRIEDLFGKPALGFIAKEDHQKFLANLRRTVVEGITRDIDYTFLKKDGTRFPGEISAAVVKDASGEPNALVAIIRDITERKQAEEATRQLLRTVDEERGHLQAIIDSLPVGLWIADATGKMTLINDTARTIWGGEAPYAENTQDYGVYKAWWVDTGKLIVAEDMPLARSLRGEICTEKVIDFQRFDGTVGTQLVSSTPIKIADGTIIGSVAIVQDITERKRAEEALRQSHDELRAIYDGLADGLLIADIETKRFVRVNDFICRMLGYTKDELLTMSVRDIHPPEHVSASEEAMHAQAEGRIHVNPNVPVRRKDGTVFYADVAGRGLVYAGRPCIIGFFRDITKRKVAQEALRQNHDQLRTIYDGIVEGLIITDIETKRIRRVNGSFCRMLGYCEEELLRKSIPDLHPPEEVSNDLVRFQAAAEGRVSVNEDRPVLRKDGNLFYADITGHRILYQGRPCLLALFRDITERKKAEEALERERQTLWHMLQASDYERRLIAYDIHDGLAQYLAAAGMQFQAHDALRENSPDAAKKAYETAVELVRQAHAESRRLISEVRPPVIDEIGLETAISHLVHEQRQRGGPKIECRSNVQFGRLPSILENALYRIVQEALANACKHSKSKNVAVTMTQEGQEVRLEVQDWGIGFAPESVEKGHFGLEGIRQRVRLLGGRMTIESTPGSGTLIQVIVPIVERQNDG